MKVILALDQAQRVPGRACSTAPGACLRRTQEFRQSSRGRLGRARPREIFATQRDAAPGRSPRRAHVLGRGGGRHHQPARRPRCSGIARRGAPSQRHCLADRRTASRCDALRQAGHDDGFRNRTGLVLDAYFSGTKLAWLLDTVPGARARAERGELAFGTIDTWLAWHLTGGEAHVTDASNASRTLLFNIHDLDWDEELLAILDIPRAVLPRVAAAGEVVGTTRCAGLPAGMPIAGLAGDQQAALFGQGCHRPGLAKNTYGTGCFLLMNRRAPGGPRANRLLTTVAWRRDEGAHYALEGSVFMGARPSSGCATDSGSSRSRGHRPPRGKRSGAAACISSPRSRGWARPLGSARAGHDRRPHARSPARISPARPWRRPRSRARSCWRDGRRFRDRAHGTARGRGGDRQRPPHADPGRSLAFPCCGRASPSDCAGARPIWRAWRSASGRTRRRSPRSGRATAHSSRASRARPPPRAWRNGAAPSSARATGRATSPRGARRAGTCAGNSAVPRSTRGRPRAPRASTPSPRRRARRGASASPAP